jgi:hypothetical protein
MMAAHDDRTQSRNYPLPHPDNLMPDDVERLRQTISGIDSDIQGLDNTQQSTGNTVSRHLFETEINLWE